MKQPLAVIIYVHTLVIVFFVNAISAENSFGEGIRTVRFAVVNLSNSRMNPTYSTMKVILKF